MTELARTRNSRWLFSPIVSFRVALLDSRGYRVAFGRQVALALVLLGLGALKGVYDLVVYPVHIADDTVLIFVSGLIIATLALLAGLIVRSRSTV